MPIPYGDICFIIVRLRKTPNHGVTKRSLSELPGNANESSVSAVQLAPALEDITHDSGGVDHNTYGPFIVPRRANTCGIIDK